MVTPTLREQNRTTARTVILDAAERLLAGNRADFSMRDLAAEAGVTFATPFNHFGSKASIMQALSARLIDRMETRYTAVNPPGDAADRVLAMADIALAILLEQPDIAKTVVGSLSVGGGEASAVAAHSRRLWLRALGAGEGLEPLARDGKDARLADHIAFMFRGCLSFWIAGELPDNRLRRHVKEALAALLLGVASPATRRRLQLLLKRKL